MFLAKVKQSPPVARGWSGGVWQAPTARQSWRKMAKGAVFWRALARSDDGKGRAVGKIRNSFAGVVNAFKRGHVAPQAQAKGAKNLYL
jgi:hypothetical protein